jgi:hypothetical protein
VYALKNNFALGAAHVQNPLVTEHLGPVNIHDRAQKVFQLGRVKRTLGFKDKAFDVIVMVVVMGMAMVCAVVVIMVGMVAMTVPVSVLV